MRWALGMVTGILALLVAACADDSPAGQQAEQEQRAIVLATTTSTQDSGLLDALVPAFQRDTELSVRAVTVGSGQAIELGRRGEVDVVLAHSPAAERELMATGVAGERRIVMHNDFLVIGPQADPARGAGRGPVAAFARIAATRAPFISRGDDSGTHALELRLWEEAGLRPSGSWYQETGQGMGATLQIAAEKEAYTVTDRASYLATRQADDLGVLVDGGPGLRNVYHVIDITQRAGRRVNVAGGRAFADWVVGSRAQEIIASFGEEEHGQPLFVPDARRDGAEDGEAL